MPEKPAPVSDSLENLLSPQPQSSEESEFLLLPEPSPLSIIRITQVALEKLYILAQEVFEVLHQPLEIYALCLGEDGIISDILIPCQDVSFASIRISPESILALIPEIQDHNLPILGWAHSHANFGVFFSGTDDFNQKIILAETSNYRKIEGKQRVKYAYGLTVNIKRALYGEVSTQFASGNRIEHKKASFRFYGGLPSSWNEPDFREYIREQIHLKVLSSSSYFSHSPAHSMFSDPFTIPTEDMEIIDEFLKTRSRKKIRRVKKLLLSFTHFRLSHQNNSSPSNDFDTSDGSQKKKSEISDKTP